jgi:hypothetical protein
MLFNIIVDIVAMLIARVNEDFQVGGLIPHLVEGCKDVNIEVILCIFDQVCGLNNNFHKSDIFCSQKGK